MYYTNIADYEALIAHRKKPKTNKPDGDELNNVTPTVRETERNYKAWCAPLKQVIRRR